MPLFSLSDISNRVYSYMDQNVGLYPLPEVVTEINNSIISYNLYSGILQTSIPQLTVANGMIYQVPQGILYPTRVEFEGKPLRPMSLLSLSRLYRGWATENSSTKYFPARWACIDMTNFVINPMDAIGGGELVVTGVQEPVPLVNPGDTIPLEDSDMEMIAEFTAYVLLIKEGASQFKQSAATLQAFYREMKEKSRWLQNVNPRFWVKLEQAEVQQEVAAQ